MPDSLVIDTNILVNFLKRSDRSLFFKINKILENIVDGNKLRIAIDDENKIITEYEENIKNFSGSIEKKILETLFALHHKVNSNKFHFISQIPYKDIEKIMTIGFHKNDEVFLRISPKSDLKIIVTLDNRSFHKYKDVILEKLKVKTFNPIEFADEIK